MSSEGANNPGFCPKQDQGKENQRRVRPHRRVNDIGPAPIQLEELKGHPPKGHQGSMKIEVRIFNIYSKIQQNSDEILAKFCLTKVLS